VWAWDTKGYTPKTRQHDDYFVPVIYPFPLKMYFTEGAYIQIDEHKTPLTQNCMTPPGSCERVSPLNLNDRDGAPNPPYQARPDKTVEFNQIGFDASGGVTFVGRPGKRYKCADVLRRTIAHEMGHALLTADEGDHCENPSCLMYRYTVDWELHDFGGTGGYASGAGWCEHRPGGAQDIRRLNVVHNEIP
jgi:hypothetical protein